MATDEVWSATKRDVLNAARECVNSDSPERAREALVQLMEALCDDFINASEECDSAWQDPHAGRTWRILCRQVSTAANKLKGD